MTRAYDPTARGLRFVRIGPCRSDEHGPLGRQRRERRPFHIEANLRHTVLRVVAVAGAWIAFHFAEARAEWVGDGELLRNVASAHRANKDAIRTWEGEATVTSTDSDVAGKNGVLNTAHVSFAYDRDIPALHWAWAYERCVRTDNGNEHDVALGRNEGILKSGTFYQLDPASRFDGDRNVRYLIRAADELRHGHMSDNFDPFVYFSPHAATIEQRFEGLHELWTKRTSASSGWTITSDGDMATVETRRNLDEGEAVNRYRINTACSCMLASYESFDPELQQSIEIEYDNVDGIFVPRTFLLSLKYLKTDRVVSHQIHWTRNVLNHPLDENEFSLTGLGARSGDHVEDTRARVRFTFRPDDERYRPSWLFFALVGGPLLLLATLAAVYRWRVGART